MDKDLDIQIAEALKAYMVSGVEDQVDYQKFYLYSIVTHSTAIEGSTVTEIENQLLFDEGIAAKGRSLTEQMMNVDLKDAYLHAFKIASENPTYTPQLLQQLSALVMRRTGSEYSTIAGQFDSSKGEFRLSNVSAGIGGKSYLAYNKVPRAVEDFCKWLNDEIANIDKTDIAACYRLTFEAHFLYAHCECNVFKAFYKALPDVFEIVITENQINPAVESIKNLIPLFCASKAKVSKVEHCIVFTDNTIPVVYHRLVRLPNCLSNSSRPITVRLARCQIISR